MELDLSMAPESGKKTGASGLDLSMAPDPGGSAGLSTPDVPLEPQVNRSTPAQSFQRELNLDSFPGARVKDVLSGSAPDTMVISREFMRNSQPSTPYREPEKETFLDRLVQATGYESDFAEQTGMGGIFSSAAKQVVRAVPGMAKSANESLAMGAGVLDSTERGIGQLLGTGSTGVFGKGRDWFLAQAEAIRTKILSDPSLSLPKEKQGRLWDNPGYLLDPEWLTFNTGDAAASMAPMVVATVLSGGNTTVGAVIGSAQEAGDLYRELMLEDKADPDRALAASIVFGVAVEGLEKLGLDRVMDKRVADTFLKRVMKAAYAGATEGFTEWAEEPIQAALQGMALKENPEQLRERVFDALKNVDVIPGSFILGGGMSAHNTRMERKAEADAKAVQPDQARTAASEQVPAAGQQAVPTVAPESSQEVPTGGQLPAGRDVMSYTRVDAQEDLVRHYGEEKAAPIMAVWDAVADSWAEREGSTRDAWYEQHLAGIVSPEGHQAAPEQAPYTPDSQQRDPQAPGMDVQELRSALSPLQENSKNALPLEIVQGVDELPEHLRADADTGEGTPTAVWDPETKRVYMLADAIDTPEQAVAMWMHEQGAHVGLRGLFGERLDPFLDRVAEQVGEKRLGELAQLHGLDLMMAEDRRHAAEEHLASLAEKIKAGEELSEAERGVWAQVLEALHQWLAEMGVVKPEAISETEIAEAVRAAIRWTRYGESVPSAAARIEQGGDKAALRKLFQETLPQNMAWRLKSYLLYDVDPLGEFSAGTKPAKKNGRVVSGVFGLSYEDAVYTWGKEGVEGIQRGLVRKDGMPLDRLMQIWGIEDAQIVYDALHFNKSKALEQFVHGGGRMLYQSAFHGSPYRFDKFTLDHIGSGNGAQSYGWGLYFAGIQEAAEYYRQAPEGQLYEVTIPDDHTMLDWGKSLSEQPKQVKAALESSGVIEKMMSKWESGDKSTPPPLLTGEEIYHAIEEMYPLTFANVGGYAGLKPDDRAASEYLKSIGIPGLRYLDGTSRGKGEGHHNYVVFDDAQIAIDKTYYQDAAPGDSAYSDRMSREAGPRAGLQFLDDGRAIVYFFQSADVSSAIHETGHVLRRMLPQADQAIVEKWCGVQNGAWTREAEEQFAKGFERYIYEGQAPTSRLRVVFQTLRDMLVRIYGSIKGIGGVKLSPEIRQVFDRMVSTQKEREAEAMAADAVHSFRVDEEAGAPGYEEELPALFHEIKAYEDLMAEAERLAYERFDKERRKEVRELRSQWRAEGREIADGYQPHKAMDAAMALGGLDHGIISEGYDAEFVRQLTMKRPGLVKRGTGVDPSTVAYQHGYTDAHDMLEDFLDVPSKGQIVSDYLAKREEAYQRQRALDKDFGGDYMAIQDAALEILGRMTKVHTLKIETMQAREKVDELRMYDLGKLRGQARAERMRLQDQARQAFNADDVQRAQQLLNQMRTNDMLLREMERALAERKKMERSAKTMFSRRLEEDWRQQTRKWAGLFGLGGAKSEGGGPELLDYLAAKGLHHFVDQQAIESLSRVPKGALTVDQYRDAHRVLRQIIHFGTWDSRIIGQKKAMAFDAVMGDVLGAILEHAPGSAPVNIHPEPPSARRPGVMGSFLDSVSAYHAELLRPEHIFRQLDSQRDMGPVWTACYKPLVDSRNSFLGLGEQVQAMLEQAFAPVHKELGEWRSKRITIPEVPRNIILRKGRQMEVREGAPLQLTMEEIVMAALNSGNEGNREALKAGFQWTEADLAAILSRLGEREWDVVHKVWNAIEAIYPHLNRAHKQLTGVELKKVQPTPFVATTRDGAQVDVRGGYFPLAFDRELSWKADRQQAMAEAQDLFQSIYQKPNPKSGFTKERVGGRMAPRLDFGVIARHVLDTVHYATHAVAIRDVQKIVTDPRFREGVEAAWSRPVYEQIAPWLQNVARPAREERSRMEQFFARARRNVQVVAMGWKPFTAMLQLTSLTSTAYKVGAVNTMRALGTFLAHPFETQEFVAERSIAVRNRRNSFEHSITDALAQFDPVKGGTMATIHGTAHALTGMVDSFVAYATWQAAYTKAMEEHGWNEAQACEYADMQVRLSQGDGAAMSVARVQHANELRKFVTMFYSWFSANYNNIAEANRKAFGEGVSLPAAVDLAKAYWWLLIGPALLEQLIRRGPPEDDKEKRDMGLSILTYFMSSFPVLRSMWDFALGKVFSDGSAGAHRFQISAIQDALEAPGDFIGALGSKKDRGRKIAKEGLMGAGYLWGLPTRQAVTVMDAALDMADGKTRNPLRFIIPDPNRNKAKGRRMTYGGNGN